jgi:hypothetical protein
MWSLGENRSSSGAGLVTLEKIEREVLFQKIDRPILQAELNIDLRKRRQELGENRL